MTENDCRIISNSLTTNLFPTQSSHLTPSDLTENNFILASDSDQSNDNSSDSSNEAMIISLSIVTPILLTAGYFVYAKMTNHWPFLPGEIADKTVEVNAANPMQETA